MGKMANYRNLVVIRIGVVCSNTFFFLFIGVVRPALILQQLYPFPRLRATCTVEYFHSLQHVLSDKYPVFTATQFSLGQTFVHFKFFEKKLCEGSCGHCVHCVRQ